MTSDFKFQIIDISSWTPTNIEEVGTRRKKWYVTGPTDAEERWLFKTPLKVSDETWAEKVACELANLLGLPAALYELATDGKDLGVISRSFSVGKQSDQLILGGRLLGIPSSDPVAQRRGQSREIHRVDLVKTCVNLSGLPRNWVPPFRQMSAIDVFAGYLLFDVWIGNTDRHEQNWGLVFATENGIPQIFLAPTFDHASCLGWNATDESREEKLGQGEIAFESFFRKAQSQMLSQVGAKMRLFDVFEYFANAAPDRASYWIATLRGISMEEVERVLRAVPDNLISDPAIRFALQLLQYNRTALLDKWDNK